MIDKVQPSLLDYISGKATLKIATRRSPLAIWQADWIKQSIAMYYPNAKVELCPILTEGDKKLNTSLAKIGGKGLFIKALEDSLINKRADIAVHSMKDMTAVLAKKFVIAAVLPRGDSSDAFVSLNYRSFTELPPNGLVGTSSVRRQSQLLALRPDLKIRWLRGNVNTRLSKLENGDFDAILLATAGLVRLGLADKIKQRFLPSEMLPAIGQGAIGVECLADNKVLAELLTPLNCTATAACVYAERAMNQYLGGHCAAPIAGLARIEGNSLILSGKVLGLDGVKVLSATHSVHLEHNQSKVLNYSVSYELGKKVALALLEQGAEALLKAAEVC